MLTKGKFFLHAGFTFYAFYESPTAIVGISAAKNTGNSFVGLPRKNVPATKIKKTLETDMCHIIKNIFLTDNFGFVDYVEMTSSK
jgi:hypothetical protein